MGVVAFQQYEQTYYHWTAYLKMAKKGNFMLRVPYRNQKKKKKWEKLQNCAMQRVNSNANHGL